MPKKVFTQEDIDKLNDEARVNKKHSNLDTGNISDRIGGKEPKSEIINGSKPNQIVVSNVEKSKTEISFIADREYYSRSSFENTFDTEISQLKTPAPPVEPDPAPDPPPAPSLVQIRCLNHHWTMDGGKGRTEKDQPSWHHNHHPLGNNPGGGGLVIPGDHPLFLLYRCEPKTARKTFNFEWSVDGNVVSQGPSFHMFDCPDQKPEDDKWREAPDIVISVRVWNESGELKASYPIRCSKSIGHTDHRDENGDKLPQKVWKGVRYFDEKKFWKGGNYCYTEYIMDEKYKPRKVHLSKITFEDYDKYSWSRPSKFNAKPWFNKETGQSRQLLPDIDRPEPDANGNWSSRMSTEHYAHAKNHQKWENENKKELFHGGRYNPWNRSERAFIGEVYINDDWKSFGEIWSGYENKSGLKPPGAAAPDRYDARNFMRLDEDGKPAHTKNWTKDGDKVGTTAMQRLNAPIYAEVPLGEKITIGFKYGFRKSSSNNKDLTYVIFTGHKSHTVKEDDPESIWLNIKLKATEIKYDNTVYDYDSIDDAKVEEAENSNQKFTKSTAAESKVKKTNTRGGRRY